MRADTMLDARGGARVRCWTRLIVSFVCVTMTTTLAPSARDWPTAALARSRGAGSAAPGQNARALQCPAGFIPLAPRLPLVGCGGFAALCPPRAVACFFGRRPLGVGSGARLRQGDTNAAGPQMILPGGSGFEEAEEVAARLFRKTIGVQDRGDDDEFDASRKPAAAVAGRGDLGEKEVVEVELQRPLGFTLKEVRGYGIYVDYVDEGGSAALRGVQRGDRVLATSATMGGGMWVKSTLDGVLSALNSGTQFNNRVRVRFERDAVLASIVGLNAEASDSPVDLRRALISVERARLRVQTTTVEEFEVPLPLPRKDMAFKRGENPFTGSPPYGLLLRQDEEGVFVADISPGGTAAQSGLLRVGDRITATQASLGTKLWPKKTLDGILAATLSRMGSSIMLRIAREVQLGTWEQRSSRVIPASPLDKVAYFSTSGAGISIRKNATQSRLARQDQQAEGADAGKMNKARGSTLSTSLVLLPDQKAWDMVQEIRVAHDRKVHMWPPHITLLRPFVRVDDFTAAAEVLDQVLNDFPPMSLTFEMRTIKHHDFCTSLWLVPDAQSREAIVALQAAVQAAFPQCRRSKYLLKLLNKNKYIPHMTLGQFQSESEALVLKALYEKKLAERTGEGSVQLTLAVNQLFLLSRPDKYQGPVEQMRVQMGPPSSDSKGFASAVSEYASLKKAGVALNASKTRSVLLERSAFDVIAFGKAHNVTGINSIVDGLSKGTVEMDSKLLNTVMGAYLKCGRPELAVSVFSKFTRAEAGLPASSSAVLVGAGAEGAAQADALGAVPAGEGAEAGAQVGAKARRADDAVSRVFAGDDFVAEDGALAVDASVHCYATLITALGRCGRLDRAHQVLARMVEQGPAPNIRVVNALLGACVRVKNLKAAEKLFASLTGVRGEGFASFVTPATAAGVRVAVQPDAYSFNIMINAYARARRVEQASRMLVEMRRANCTPDAITYSTLIKAYVSTAQMSRAFGLLEDMAKMQMLDATAFNTVLAGLARRKQWRQAKELLSQMEDEEGVDPDLMSYSHGITACVRARRVDEAKKMFRTMQDRGIVANRQVYSTLMAGFGASGALNEAQALFKLMQERRVSPNEFTMSSLIEAYLKAGYAADALKIQQRLPEMGLVMDDVLETQRIRALAQLGLFSNATEALLALREGARGSQASLGPIPYNEIVKQAQLQARPDLAKETLALMLAHKVTPNRMTYELMVLLTDPSLQGMKRVTYLLDIIALVRENRLVPMGPLYVAALQASVEANEPELCGLLLDDAAAGKFSISRAEHGPIEMLETRVLNLQRMSADGKWYTRSARLGSSGRLGSGKGGRIGSGGRSPFITGSDYDEWDFEGQSNSANPEDRDYMSAEWW